MRTEWIRCAKSWSKKREGSLKSARTKSYSRGEKEGGRERRIGMSSKKTARRDEGDKRGDL